MKRSAMVSQPLAMRTGSYIGMGLARVDGNAAWELICACIDGDEALVSALLDDDTNLANVQYWYQTPIHFAVRQGHVAVVRRLLQHGNPTSSCYGCGEWGQLLEIADLRGLAEMSRLLRDEMSRHFGYSAEFSEIADAIRAYDPNRVEQELADRPEQITCADASGNTAIHWATLTHQPDLLGMLAARGADLNAQRADGKSPVMLALHGDYDFRWWRDVPKERQRTPSEMIIALIDAGAEQPLGLAIHDGNSDAVRQTLDQEPNAARALDGAGYSPLYYASLGASLAMTELLLEHGGDPNAPEREAPRGRALHQAAAQNNLPQARLLLAGGADPDGVVDSSGNCLHIVASRHPQDHGAMQALLRDYGAEPASWQMTAGELAAALQAGRQFDDQETLWTDVLEKNDLDLLDLLIARSPEVPAQLDAWIFRPGAPALVATRSTLERLIEHGFDIRRGDWRGATLLHYCAEFGDAELAAFALELGAPIDAVELTDGGTPLATAARCGTIEMVTLLLDNGADPSVPAAHPWAQPAAQARRAGHHHIVQLLGEP